jgi:hypothetical protein
MRFGSVSLFGALGRVTLKLLLHLSEVLHYCSNLPNVTFQLLVTQVPESFEDILQETTEIKLIMTPRFQEIAATTNYAVCTVPGITVF